jgi:uncharacterized membrane protein
MMMTDKNSFSHPSKEFFQEQIAILKRQYQFIQKRIDHLEKQLQQWTQAPRDEGSARPQQPAPGAAEKRAPAADASLEKSSATASSPHAAAHGGPSSASTRPEDMEMNFGRYWLNKIGLVIFTLGIGFLITYAFQHFPAIGKIALGYAISLVLFAAGWKCEQKKGLAHFGRVLLGGGWAMTYFTTFAMHHFEASRVIQSQPVDLLLLFLVVSGMLVHSLKYASQTMTAIALAVAYITATLGPVNFFTFISCLFLAVVVLCVAYRYQWMKMLFLGIGLTYGVHYFWTLPNMRAPLSGAPQVWALGLRVPLELLFVGAYGLVFLTGLHLIKSQEPRERRQVLVANYLNFFLFYALAFPLIMDVFYAQRFVIVLGLGLFYLVLAAMMKGLRRDKLFMSDLILGVMVVTLSLPLKFLPDVTLWMWLIEIPFLLLAGYLFREKALRLLGYGLAMVYVIRLTSLCVFQGMAVQGIVWFGLRLAWCEFMRLMTALVLAVCVWISQRQKKARSTEAFDVGFEHILSFLSFWYFSVFVWTTLPAKGIALGLGLEFFLLWVLSVFCGMRRLRVYAYFLLPLILARNLFVDNYRSLAVYKWVVTGGQVFLFFCLYAGSRWLRRWLKQDGHRAGRLDREIIPAPAEGYVAMLSGFVLLVCFIYQYVAWQWISLALGLAGVALIAWGMTGLDKTLRVGGLLLLALTLLRIVFVDLAHLDVIFKIISFILLGALFLLVSYVYNCSRERMQERNDK